MGQAKVSLFLAPRCITKTAIVDVPLIFADYQIFSRVAEDCKNRLNLLSP